MAALLPAALNYAIPGIDAGINALGVTSGDAVMAEGAAGLFNSLVNNGAGAEIVGVVTDAALNTSAQAASFGIDAAVDVGEAVLSNPRAREYVFEQMWKKASTAAEGAAERAFARGAEALGSTVAEANAYIESGQWIGDIAGAVGKAIPVVGLPAAFGANWQRMMNSGSPAPYQPEALEYAQPVYEPEPDYVYSGQPVPGRDPVYEPEPDYVYSGQPVPTGDPVAVSVDMSGSSSTGGRPALPAEDTQPWKRPKGDQDDVMFDSPDLPFEFMTPGGLYVDSHRRRRHSSREPSVLGKRRQLFDVMSPPAARRRLDFGASLVFPSHVR